MPKRVLLTGVGGFIGAHCLQYWLENTDWQIIGLDSFEHKGTYTRINEALNNCQGAVDGRYHSYYHDLSSPIDPQLENLLMERKIDDRGNIVENKIDVIVNMASDSAVERSAEDPIWCWRNNCQLIANMLELARRIQPKLFLQISTDEVYGEAPPLPSPGHKEWATILPSNPYAASKAAQEALCAAYWRTFNMPICITNCMNIIAEWQDPEKFLPKIIQFVAQGKKGMPIYADKTDDAVKNHTDEDGQGWYIGTRIYLDARNKADALKFIIERPVSRYSDGVAQPDRYNICGDDEVSNLELAQMVAKIMKKELNYKLVLSESARPGYDRRYALNGEKMRKMGWKPSISFQETLERVVKWTLANPHWLV